MARNLHFEQRKAFQKLEKKIKIFSKVNTVFDSLNPVYTKIKILLGLAREEQAQVK